MAFVVTDNCIRCKYTDCVDVCPVDDCFREGENFLVIDPQTCVDCSLCVPECPAGAIFPVDEVPEDQRAYISLNAELAKRWPGLNEAKEPLDEAEEWLDVPDKLQYLAR